MVSLSWPLFSVRLLRRSLTAHGCPWEGTQASRLPKKNEKVLYHLLRASFYRFFDSTRHPPDHYVGLLWGVLLSQRILQELSYFAVQIRDEYLDRSKATLDAKNFVIEEVGATGCSRSIHVSAQYSEPILSCDVRRITFHRLTRESVVLS